jgi:hypothetical protein
MSEIRVNGFRTLLGAKRAATQLGAVVSEIRHQRDDDLAHARRAKQRESIHKQAWQQEKEVVLPFLAALKKLKKGGRNVAR